MLKKLLSRKFLTALVGVGAGLALAFGLDQEAVASTAGAAISVVSVVTYIITEGRIDSAAIGQAAQDVQDAIDAVNDVEEED